MIEPRRAALALAGLAVLALLGSALLQLTRRGGDSPFAEVDGAPEKRVRVEVLNAAAIPGLARTATERLRDAGFDVVYYGNARGQSPDSSRVLSRAGGREAADRVAAALEIGRVAVEPDTGLYLEVSVILGRDWKGIAPDTAGAPVSGTPAPGRVE